MQRSLMLFAIALVFILSQGISTTYAQRLLKKLYDDKETVRGSTGTITKKIEVGVTEHEYYYKDKSKHFPKKGTCYIQYYHAPEKVTIIVDNRMTADVLLAGVEPVNKDYSDDYFHLVYDKFIFKRTPLRFVKTGERADGMHKVVLYLGKLNINNMLNRYTSRGGARIWFQPPPRRYPEPVWRHRTRGRAWLPASYTRHKRKAKKRVTAPTKIIKKKAAKK